MRLEVPKPPYSEDIAATLEKWSDGSPIDTPEIFEAFHIHPKLASRTGVLGAGFLGHCLMSKRDREIIIHRITGKYGAEHEWGLHATIFGKAVGLTEEQLDSTVGNPSESPEHWTSDELRLIAVVDELADTTDLCDASWAFLENRYDDKQIIEFIILVGWYRTVSSMCNTLRISPHPHCRCFPE